MGAPDMSDVVRVTCSQQGAAAQVSAKRSSSRSIRSERSRPASRWTRADDFREDGLSNCAWSQPKNDIDLFLSKRDGKDERYAARQVRHSVAESTRRPCGAQISKTGYRTDCHADC